jgi:hypothetical protein
MKRMIALRWTRLQLVWSAGVIAWAAVIVGGFGALLAYEFRGGKQSAPPVKAAGAVAKWLGNKPFHLVLALHPKCPCSRASVAELERLAAQCGADFDITVLVTAPLDAGDDWVEAPLVREARERLHATIVHDANGALAGELGMRTSGAVVLLDSQGQSHFFGGITSSRGHEGDSAGADAIRDIVGGRLPSSDCSAVFGCPLVQGGDD